MCCGGLWRRKAVAVAAMEKGEKQECLIWYLLDIAWTKFLAMSCCQNNVPMSTFPRGQPCCPRAALLPFPVSSKESYCLPWIILGSSCSSDPKGLLRRVSPCAKAMWSWLDFSERWCWEALVLCIYSCRMISEWIIHGKAVLMSWNADGGISYPILQCSTELKYLLCS